MDPAVLERGRGVYVGSCGACHGVDARGGQLGGPNLLRSQLVLNDKDGELIVPVVKNGRPGHADGAASDRRRRHQGHRRLSAQPAGPGQQPGRPAARTAGRAQHPASATPRPARRTSPPSAAPAIRPTGDLQGIATRVADPKALQNLWVSGGRAAGGGAGAAAGRRRHRVVPTATVTLPSGEKVEGRLAAPRRLPRHGGAGRRHDADHPPRRRRARSRGAGSARVAIASCCRSSPTPTCTT